jgi:putative transposase
MPRHARFRLDGYSLHIIQRGNNRGACFVDDLDRILYLSLLEEFSECDGCEVHAYVLMTNHVHLLATPACAANASQFMKDVGQRYAQHFNRKYRRTGSLWEGRFRSSIVDSEGYLLRCSRYIELNPVRAGMVRHPAFYRWSSYRANADGEPSNLVRPHRQYLALGPDDLVRRSAYREFLIADSPRAEVDQIRRAWRGGFALGGEEFTRRLSAQLGRPVGRTRVASALER